MGETGIDTILKYFPNLSAHQIDQFRRLPLLYAEWNDKINVVSRKDIDGIVERHLLHSLGIAKIIDLKPNSKILDIGTGGGFPGIPLAIFFPEVKFHLVDSIGKKIKVVLDIKEQLNLTNLSAEHKRAESVNDKFDFIVSRAVAPIRTLDYWSKGKLKTQGRNELKNGFLFLKGGDLTDEIKESKLKCKEFSLTHFFDEPFFETKKVVHVLPKM